MALRTFPANTHDKNLFYRVNRGSRMRPQRMDTGVPQKFGEADNYHSYASPTHPLPPEKGGDRSAHYVMLREGLLPKVPTFRRRIFTDFDPETRIDESIPMTREERQQDKLVQGVKDIAQVLKDYTDRGDVSFRQKVSASHQALRSLLEKHNVSVKDSKIDALTPAQVKHIFEDLERKFASGEDMDASEVERAIAEIMEKEAEHKHEEKKMTIKEEEEEEDYDTDATEDLPLEDLGGEEREEKVPRRQQEEGGFGLNPDGTLKPGYFRYADNPANRRLGRAGKVYRRRGRARAISF